MSPYGKTEHGWRIWYQTALITQQTWTDRHIYNAKVNIYRQQAGPIYLGVQDKEMQTFENDHTGETVSQAAE